MRPPGLTLASTCLAVCLAQASLASAAPAAASIRWRRLQAGLHYATLPVVSPVNTEDKLLHLVKVAPDAAQLRVGLASRLDRRARTAAEWAKKLKLAAVINLGMYQGNQLTHVGYLRADQHVNSKRLLPKYDSLLVIGPDRRAALVDRDPAAALDAHSLVVQNLRLIRSRDGRTGENVWTQKEKRWSEAALAMDRAGNLLFVFCRAPLTMFELNQLLLRLPLGVVRAMHLEGGPEASLSIHAGGVDLDLSGSFETGFMLSDLNKRQWPLPNILGVARR